MYLFTKIANALTKNKFLFVYKYIYLFIQVPQHHNLLKKLITMKLLTDLYSKICFFICLSIIILSCTKTTEVDPNPKDSYLYFPIEVGDFKLFQKVVYSYAVGQKERIDSILVKETVTSKSQSNNETYYLIERQAKGKNDLFFKPEAVYQIITNPKQVINTERNIYTVLLYYPIYLGSKWDINEINGQDEKEAEIVNLGKLPAKLITNKDLILVQSDSTNNFVDFKVSNKIFAKNIGLIYSENSAIDYCQDSDPNPATSCTSKFIIESGKREFITLLEYGSNKK